jgi:hypothetical protein
MIIQLDHIPNNIEDFVSMRNELANTPEGGAAIFVLAMLLYAENKDLGSHALTIAFDRSNLHEDSNGYKGFSPATAYNYHLQSFSEKPYWAKSYILGTAPKDGYQLAAAPYQVQLSRNSYSELNENDIKIFVACSGADSPRPIRLCANDKGLWKVKECSSLFLGMRAPEDNSSDDL